MVKRNVRINIYERDGNMCVKCKSTENLTLDHIIPLSEGGSNYHTNIQTLCWDCNQKKAGTIQYSFWGKIKKIWILPEMFSAFKNAIQGAVIGEALFIKKFVQTESAKHQSLLDSRINEQNIRIKEGESRGQSVLDRKLNEYDKTIKEQEQVILMLVDYLGIEAVPSKIVRPYFKKKTVIPLTDLS